MLPEVLDTHLHWWDLSALSYPWVADGELFFVDRTRLPSAYRPADYGADVAGTSIRPYVHVQAGARREDAVAETRWLDGLATGALLVVAADLARTDLAAHLDAHQAAASTVVGVRDIITWHPDPALSFVDRDWLGEPAWRRGLAEVASRGLSFDLQLYPHQADAAVGVVRRQPGLRFIVEHSGLPSADRAGWRRAMTRLAREPNVAVKAGGLAMTRRDWGRSDGVGLIRELLDVFGPDRLMFGSNFPVERASHRLAEVYATWSEALGPYTPAEIGQACSLTARTWYPAP